MKPDIQIETGSAIRITGLKKLSPCGEEWTLEDISVQYDSTPRKIQKALEWLKEKDIILGKDYGKIVDTCWKKYNLPINVVFVYEEFTYSKTITKDDKQEIIFKKIESIAK